jgi:hypothetical protein
MGGWVVALVTAKMGAIPGRCINDLSMSVSPGHRPLRCPIAGVWARSVTLRCIRSPERASEYA